jgi:cytochrome b pre-mRNA-processing protein 3
VGFFQRIFGAKQQRARLQPLYAALVTAARDPSWYREGQVPDTIDGRFDMVAAILSLVLIRLEREEDRHAPTLLTELFIDDMEGTLRQIGIGDLMVGKHVGKMVGALGGRLTAFRAGMASDAGLGAAVTRNIFHDSPPSAPALGLVVGRLEALGRAIATQPIERLLDGELAAS